MRTIVPFVERERRLRNAAAALLAEVDRHVPPGPSRIYLKALVVGAVRVRSAQTFWRDQGYRGSLSTMQARFWRGRMPSTKHTLALARLVYVAALFEAGVSARQVSIELDHSSQHEFARWLRLLVGMTPTQWRTRVGVAEALARFRNGVLVGPSWYTFDPFLGLCFEVPFPPRRYEEVRLVAEAVA